MNHHHQHHHEHDPHNGHHDAHHHDHRDIHNHHNRDVHSENCHRCLGTGNDVCRSCQRTGRVKCRTCHGSGRLKWFMQLECTYIVNEDEFISRSLDEKSMAPISKEGNIIPDELIRNCVSQNVFSEQNTRVFPIDHFQDVNINQASRNLIESHSMRFNNCKIIAQVSVLFFLLTLYSILYLI
jgi:hypothetical protein